MNGQACAALPLPDGRTIKLLARQVRKPWGRTVLPPPFDGDTCSERIGELWFEHPGAPDLPLLVKYIHTSEPLSIQVHPDDTQARARGLARGKSECWYIVDADPGAVIGLGLRRTMFRDELRDAARDSSIDSLLHWRTVSRGDFVYVPAGTIHSIGAGIALLEIGRTSDVTYRLFDYNRARELHVDDGVAVSTLHPSAPHYHRGAAEAAANLLLLSGPFFSVVKAASADAVPPALANRMRWVMPLVGTASADGESASAGECLLVRPTAPLLFSQGTIALVAASGPL
jgi:mannose-6-phosphate isomerase